MKTIGLIGGVSWQSTVDYYRIINGEISERLGGLNSARILLYSFNFAELEPFQRSGDDGEVTRLLVSAAQKLQRSGADFILICSNTTNKNADQVAAQIDVPLIHIADVTGEAIRKKGLKRVGLLGTKYTMEQDFIKKRLNADFGLEILIPGKEDRIIVNSIIYEELCLGIIREASRREYRRIILGLEQSGAQGIILGCTEIRLLVSQDDVDIPVFDTTSIHALKAAELALQSSDTLQSSGV